MRNFLKVLIATTFIAILFCGCPAKISVSCDKNGKYIASCTPHFSDEFIANLSQILENSSDFAENSLDLSQINKEYSDIIPDEFIRTKKLNSGKTEFAIEISQHTIQKFLSQQDDERLSTIFESSMAPIISGEEMSQSEYRELLEDVYGANVAGEILGGVIIIEFTSPDGKKYSRQMPAADLLVSTEPQFFTFVY